MSDSVVFRMQDREGRGPWRPGFSHVWVEDKSKAEMERLKPWIMEFPNLTLRPGFHYGVGCVSLQQLRQWISESEYRTLRKHGYRCVKMNGRVIARSEVQAVFERSEPLRKGCKSVNLWPSPEREA